VLHDLQHAWNAGIVDAGKLPELLLYVSFLVTFGFIRTSTHMIKAGVSWWPGNVETKGGTHLHHMVFGITGLLIVGFVTISFGPDTPAREILAVFFGIAVGLTLDEFALWVNLEDVYWAPKGRQSIDAVIVASTLGLIALLGVRVWLDVGHDLGVVLAYVGLVGVLVTALNLAKGKLVMAVLSAVLPPVGVPSLFRLARPDSLWAKTYSDKKLARAKKRFPEPWLPGKIYDHHRDHKAATAGADAQAVAGDEAPEKAAPPPEPVASGHTDR
jgi:hypothetical protein